jgi:hypothetical protein
MSKKILEINSCIDCCHSDLEKEDWCCLVEADIEDITTIPEWCPLPSNYWTEERILLFTEFVYKNSKLFNPLTDTFEELIKEFKEKVFK